MNVWIPGLVVVAVGVAIGLWMALKSRSANASPSLTEEASISGGDAPNASPAGPPQSLSSRRSSGLVGFVAGVASCLLIGGLIYWATQGAQPKPEMGGSPAARPSAPTAATPEAAERAHDESAELTPEVRAQLDALRQQVAAAPQDLNARRQLSVALLNANQLMEAFEQAREIQKSAPNDPDGVFVEGVVRLAMGQWPVAVELMDRVLAQHPDHVLASLAKGQAQAALGQTPAAIATWKKGLAAAGGTFPPLEELIAEAESGSAGTMPGAPPAPAAPMPDAGGGGAYRVHIELAAGAAGPRGGDGGAPTLFVALRGTAPGPPAAVKRISNPVFPLELTLSDDDSMMGQPLPERGSLSIHLDGDGNASTREPGDLTATVDAFAGTPVTVILENGAP